jgi:hypothetical protein
MSVVQPRRESSRGGHAQPIASQSTLSITSVKVTARRVSYVQVLGSATVNHKDSVLKANKHHSMMMMTSQRDMALAFRHCKFIREIHSLII